MRFSVIGSALVVVSLMVGSSFGTPIISVDVDPPTSGGVLYIGDNLAVVYKDFNPWVGLGPIDVNFTVNGPGNYWLAETKVEIGQDTYYGFVHNYSGQDWTDFHFQLLAPAGVQFYSAMFDAFGTGRIGPTSIDLCDGAVPVGTDFHPQVLVVVPPEYQGPVSFTVRQTATVPEPSTLALLAGGAAALLICVCQRRRRR
jgi:hypothetical protein